MINTTWVECVYACIFILFLLQHSLFFKKRSILNVKTLIPDPEKHRNARNLDIKYGVFCFQSGLGLNLHFSMLFMIMIKNIKLA